MKHRDIDNGICWFAIFVIFLLVVFILMVVVKVSQRLNVTEKIVYKHMVEEYSKW